MKQVYGIEARESSGRPFGTGYLCLSEEVVGDHP